MVKRFAALLIAIAVAAAPVALEACEISCASGTTMTTGTGAHAMHHHGAAAPRSADRPGSYERASSRLSAPCDHDGDVIVPSVVTPRTNIVASAALRSVASDLPETVRAMFADRGWSVSIVDRLGLRLSVPLRI